MTDFSRRVVAFFAPESALSQALITRFTQQGANVVGVPDDAIAADFAKAHPSIDTLVLILPPAPPSATLELNNTMWEASVAAMLTRCFQLIRAVGAGMVSRQQGVILILGGLSGLTGFPGWAAASALEGGLVALMRSLACEWASHGVRVLYLACGALEDTPLAQMTSGEHTLTHSAVERTPLKRCATADEIAQITIYLTSSRASFITGSVVHADGGWTSWGLLK